MLLKVAAEAALAVAEAAPEVLYITACGQLTDAVLVAPALAALPGAPDFPLRDVFLHVQLEGHPHHRHESALQVPRHARRWDSEPIVGLVHLAPTPPTERLLVNHLFYL